MDQLHPAYFHTRFAVADPGMTLPHEFAIITAYATTGQTWTNLENEAADRELGDLLREGNDRSVRITGFSPDTGHTEPGWLSPISWSDACDTGLRFKQDAIYFVSNDTLFVSHCDKRRELVLVGPFRERLSCSSDLPKTRQ